MNFYFNWSLVESYLISNRTASRTQNRNRNSVNNVIVWTVLQDNTCGEYLFYKTSFKMTKCVADNKKNYKKNSFHMSIYFILNLHD